jgi:hypothetical protein
VAFATTFFEAWVEFIIFVCLRNIDVLQRQQLLLCIRLCSLPLDYWAELFLQ